MRLEALADRIADKFEVLPDGCWKWLGAPNVKGGYGRISVNGKQRVAHCFIYEVFVEPIPKGLELDHLCRVRLCVNPDHLEPVTRKENVLRGVGLAAQEASLTHCLRGHPFSGENLVINSKNKRLCKACKKQRSAAEYLRRKERLGSVEMRRRWREGYQKMMQRRADS